MKNLAQLFGDFNSLRTATYRALSRDDTRESHDESKGLVTADEEGSPALAVERYSWWRGVGPHYLLFAVVLILQTLLLVVYLPGKQSDAECAKQLSTYSPMHEAIEFVEFDFHHDFDVGSEYRGPPTPRLEKAWERLWSFDPVPFPESKLSLVNRTGGFRNDDEKLARLGDVKEKVTEDNRGPVAANFEVFHQIHCLNYLRQYTWRDWYFEHPDKVVIPQDMLASDVGVRIHADHCIDYLRTVLMCHGDTTPFFTIVDPSQPMGARGDFNAHHKCKDFGKLQNWNRKHGVKFGSFAEDDQ